MLRKKWTPREQSPDVLESREKRKWQIALRRYVFLQSPCTYYAPFFGLDATKMREWIATQFEEGMNWENFSREWYFGHVLSPSFFDFTSDEDLKLCWNFLNINVVKKAEGENGGLAQAKQYYQKLYASTGLELCSAMLAKIEAAESYATGQFENRLGFAQVNKEYIQSVAIFDAYQFEQLNNGANAEDILREKEMLDKF